MLILRMLSGLVARALGLAGRRKKFAPAAEPGSAPGGTRPGAADETETGGGAERLGKAAAFHARAARKAVEVLDGEGILGHMRHFRRYSSDLLGIGAPSEPNPLRGPRCEGCGSTCARRDMSPPIRSARDPGRRGSRLSWTCFACDPGRSRPSWTTADGRRLPVAEMGEDHLANSAAMVRRWLRDGRAVSDDRIRMCGHVLVECGRRGILREVAG